MKRLLAAVAVVLSGAMGVAQSTPSGQVTSGTPVVQTAPAARPGPTTEQQLAAAQTKLMDWPQLGRYAAENAALPAPAAGEQRVVFYGDSITDAWGRRPNTGTFFPGKPYVNRGISGQTTPQMVVRFIRMWWTCIRRWS